MENRIFYLFFIVFAWLIIWSWFMGIDKMMRCILWNALTWLICYFLWESIHILINNLLQSPDLVFMGFSYESYAHFLDNCQFTIIMIFFVSLTILNITSSKIQVTWLETWILWRWLFFFLIPLCAISFIFSFYLSLQWEGIQTFNYIKESFLKASESSQYFFQYFPVWNFIYYMLIIFITAPLKITIIFKTMNTIIPEEISSI